MTRPGSSRAPLAILSVVALALLFGRAVGSGDDAASPVVEPVVRDRVASIAPRKDAVPAETPARPRRTGDEPVVDLFSGRSWTPPPAPAPVVAVTPPPPPAPTAPALPFAYMGRVLVPDEKPVVYLARGDRLVTASEGDVVEQVYRIESLDDEKIVFVFMPLGQRQVLRIDGETK